MPTNLFIPRSAGDVQHPLYPLPGAEPGSVAFEEGDGATQSFVIGDFEVEVFDGRSRRQSAWGTDLRGTLVVTDTRLVFASTRMLKSFRGTKGLTFMGQIRYEWLGGIAGGMKPARYLRAVFPSPDPSDADGFLNIVTFRPLGPIYGRMWNADELAADVARRAGRRRELVADSSAPAFEERDLPKAGRAWIAVDAASPWRAAITELSTKRLGLYG